MKVEQRVREEQEKEQRRHSLPKRQKNKEQNVSSSYNSQERKAVLGRIERQQMVKDEIIVSVVEPTEWVSRMLVVGKPDGDVRICLDPSELNKAILRQHFAVPTVEQLFAKIGKAKYFCSLDAASGFYQIPLSDRASYLCTMATPKGRYRFLRLPFGLKSAPEVYLQVMSDLFGDIPGVIIYFDDFLVVGALAAVLGS